MIIPKISTKFSYPQKYSFLNLKPPKNMEIQNSDPPPPKKGSSLNMYEISEYPHPPPPPPPTRVQNSLSTLLFVKCRVCFSKSVFSKSFQEYHQSVKQSSSRSDPMFLLGLMVWVQTVCFRLSTGNTSGQRVRLWKGFFFFINVECQTV